MRRLLISLTLLGCSILLFPQQLKDMRIKGTLALSQPVHWKIRNLIFENDSILKTNGFDVDIEVMGDLAIRGSAKIRAFNEKNETKRPTPNKPLRAQPTYDRGPGGNGLEPNTNGRHGGHGKFFERLNGAAGVPGKDAGRIKIKVNGNAYGSLEIINRGQSGGRGGDGGEGQDGGHGEQGGRSETKEHKTPFGTLCECKKGPGHGGNGGNGGRGGNAGKGGNAGSGGEVDFQIIGDSTGFDIPQLDVRPGNEGEPGNPGKGGERGNFGWGGRGSCGCQGAINARKGNPGLPGLSGDWNEKGAKGRFGNHNLDDVYDILDKKHFREINPCKKREERTERSAKVLLNFFSHINRLIPNTIIDEKKNASGETSLFVVPNSYYKRPFMKALVNLIFNYTKTKNRTPINDCSKFRDEQLAACLMSNFSHYKDIYLDSVLALGPAQRRNELRAEIIKFTFFSQVINLYANVIAQKSMLFSRDVIPEGKFQGNKIYYTWINGEKMLFPGNQFLLTIINEELINDLSTLTYILLPEIRSALNSPHINKNTYRCSGNGVFIESMNWDNLPAYFKRVKVSQGEAAGLKASAQMKSKLETTLEIASSQGMTYFRMIEGSTHPVGKDSSMCKYIASLGQTNANSLNCLSNALTTEKISTLRNQIDHPHTSIVLFHMIYLKLVFENEFDILFDYLDNPMGHLMKTGILPEGDLIERLKMRDIKWIKYIWNFKEPGRINKKWSLKEPGQFKGNLKDILDRKKILDAIKILEFKKDKNKNREY